jgi:hypothetical protein
MAQAAIDAIDAGKPYEGGTNALWCLHRLDIADKHHALWVTLVSVTSHPSGAIGVVGWPIVKDRETGLLVRDLIVSEHKLKS